jgi:hypothetical protein
VVVTTTERFAFSFRKSSFNFVIHLSDHALVRFVSQSITPQFTPFGLFTMGLLALGQPGLGQPFLEEARQLAPDVWGDGTLDASELR